VTHNPVGDEDDASTRDVLAQVAFVAGGLEALSLAHSALVVNGAGPDPGRVAAPGVAVFNLVESPPARPRLQVEAAAALEALGVRFTGSAAEAIWLTTDKLASRRRLQEHGLWVAPGGALDPDDPRILETVPPPWILKPALEDASLGLEGDAITDRPEVACARARALAARFRQPILVEHLLDGREFNVSLLGAADEVEVLPLAEMLYVDFPRDQPRVLDWAAKWDEGSFAYRHTVRRFMAPDEDQELAARLEATARAAWEACGVSGYARVDLRLDEAGTPCVLEVNANPCLAADAGFVAAATTAGIDAAGLVRRILAAAGIEA
jgi:D-alanine-D-alanine ligase